MNDLMLNRRLELHEKLCQILGTRNVYFQPPESIKMKYPAIVYSRSDIDNNFANNNPYISHCYYDLIVIDSDPDSSVVEKVSSLPTCRFSRHYVADNLNHDLFTIYI